MKEVEVREINIEESDGMKVDSEGRVVMPVGKGDIVTLSVDVAEEVWLLMEKVHAINTLKEKVDVENRPELFHNQDWLADTFNDTKDELVSSMEGFIVEATLKELDLELAYEGGE